MNFIASVTRFILLFFLSLTLSCLASSFLQERSFYPLPASATSQDYNTSPNPAAAYLIPQQNLHLGFGQAAVASPRQTGLYLAYSQPSLRLAVKMEDLSNSKQRSTFSFSHARRKKYYISGFGLDYVDHKIHTKYGFILRPAHWLSMGYTQYLSTNNDYIIDFSLRPFNNKFTLFMEQGNDRLHNDIFQRHGVSYVISPLVSMYFSYYNNDEATLGFTYKFKGSNASVLQQQKANTYIEGSVAFDHLRHSITQESSYFVLRLPKKLTYQTHPFDTLFKRKGDIPLDFYTLLTMIDDASRYPYIDGLVLDLSQAQLNSAFIWEIRQALMAFKESGKKVIIYIENCNFNTYYLSSVADLILSNQMSTLTIDGVFYQSLHIKNSLKKLGVSVDVSRFKKYKSMGELFTRDEMSAADREQKQTIVNEQYRLMTDDILQTGRILSPSLNTIIQKNYLINASRAKDLGLIDDFTDWQDIKNTIKKQLFPSLPNKKIRFLKKLHTQQYSDTWGHQAAIAVVYLDGMIDMDKGLSARKLATLFDKLDKNKHLKVIVLRIDSPGGGVMASDVLAKAILRLKKTKKIIVSQGQYAASGGYYLSMYADYIFTTPFTLTGSIGVIGIRLHDNGLYNKLGVQTDYVQKGSNIRYKSGIFLSQYPLNKQSALLSKDLLANFYDSFTQQVAKGRQLDLTTVESLAQGRVWSGQSAVRVKLADKIGSLSDAIAYAKTLCDVSKKNTDIAFYPKPRFSLDCFSYFTGSNIILKQTAQSLNHLNMLLEKEPSALYVMPEYLGL
ncbi:MAG: signal peptide peptidase SppA [bacterium]